MVIKTLTKSLFYSAFLWFSVAEVSAQKTQKIGDNPYSIDSKAVLELESTTKGFLPPRMTTAQMNAITSPTEGMIVYCTDCGVNTDGELRIAYNSVWQTFKGDLTGNVTGTSANVTGVVAAANGGTGAATLTGYVKGNGTSTMTASATIPVADVSGAAPLASPTFTGTVTGVTSTMVGLGNVNNTSDASKPVSTATQTALDLKAPLASPTFTGTPLAPTPTAGDNTTKVATTAFVANAVSSASSGSYVNLTSAQTVAGAKTFSSPITVQSNTLKGDGSGSVRNVGLGLAVFNATVTGKWNTAMGAYAFERLTSGSNNTAIGNETLSFITTTSDNTGIGNRAIMNTTGSNNTALGSNAAVQLVTGNNNLILGNSSGSQIANNSNLTSLSNSVLMGSGTRISANGGTNEIVIGYNAVGNGSHTIQLGNTSITNVKTSGTITAGAITIPNTDGTSGQVLATNGSGTLAWSATKITAGAPASSTATGTAGEIRYDASYIYICTAANIWARVAIAW